MDKIVVGTDGSENSMLDVRWAVDEARLHPADVEAVLVWNLLDQHYPDRSDRFDPDYDDEAARRSSGR